MGWVWGHSSGIGPGSKLAACVFPLVSLYIRKTWGTLKKGTQVEQ